MKKYLSNAFTKLEPYRIEKTIKRPGSFGVYLGEIDNPPSRHQIQILSEWDLLVFDPSQAGVLDAMSSGLYPVSPQTLARLDVGMVAGDSEQRAIILIVEWIGRYVNASERADGHQHSFTGISISNWESYLPVPVLREFVNFASSLGLCVYLEASAPYFLSDPKLAEVEEVTGLAIRNGTISANGEERDAFQMNEMRPTIKAFVSQACLRSFVVLLWETLDDDVTPLNSVIKRGHQWSRFYSALPWIGSTTALVSARLSLDQKEPLGAFDWLKELRVMKFHEKWRSNQNVCQNG